MKGWVWCYEPVIPVMEEAEVGGSWFEAGTQAKILDSA
jgi:hypothetical protein